MPAHLFVLGLGPFLYCETDYTHSLLASLPSAFANVVLMLISKKNRQVEKECAA